MNEPAVNQEASGIYEFSLIPSEQISLVWNQVEEYLKKSAKRSDGRTRVEDIFYDLINNQTQLWIIFDTGNLKINGVQITLFNIYPTGKKMLNLEHTSGKKNARLDRKRFRCNNKICQRNWLRWFGGYGQTWAMELG